VGLLRVQVGKPPRNRGFFLVLVGGIVDRAKDKGARRARRRPGGRKESGSGGGGRGVGG